MLGPAFRGKTTFRPRVARFCAFLAEFASIRVRGNRVEERPTPRDTGYNYVISIKLMEDATTGTNRAFRGSSASPQVGK